VDISNQPQSNLADSAIQVLLQTFSIMAKSINAYELRDADVVVRPLLSAVGSADFGSRRRSIEAGRAAMLLALPAYRARLANLYP
jgi:NTE family protein